MERTSLYREWEGKGNKGNEDKAEVEKGNDGS